MNDKRRADLDELREQHPDWRIGSVWTSAATGPDNRKLCKSAGSRRGINAMHTYPLAAPNTSLKNSPASLILPSHYQARSLLDLVVQVEQQGD